MVAQSPTSADVPPRVDATYRQFPVGTDKRTEAGEARRGASSGGENRRPNEMRLWCACGRRRPDPAPATQTYRFVFTAASPLIAATRYLQIGNSVEAKHE